MKKLLMTIGLPRSGKSTWAKEQGYPIVNRDSIRLALHGQAYIQDAEPMVTAIEKYMVESLFIAGHDVVILDATNLKEEYRDKWSSDKWEIVYKIFTTSKDECIRRAEAGGRDDLVPVIERMYEDYKWQKTPMDKGICWEGSNF